MMFLCSVFLSLFLGAGRGGRKLSSGNRNRVIVYILYNSSDIANNIPGLSLEMKEFCTTGDCLKNFMRRYFDGVDEADQDTNPREWCCSNC